MPFKLQEVLEDSNIIKVFHDFCEDASALVGFYKIDCQGIFDTQIARRIEAQYRNEKYKHNNVGLNKLLEEVMNVNNDKKNVIQSQMKNDNMFWNQRPLTIEMMEYAGQDVIYLPDLFLNMVKRLNQVEEKTNKEINSLVDQVYIEAAKYNSYALINRDVVNLNKGQTIQAFVRSIQKLTFCSLNLGIGGCVNHERSHEYIKKHHKIGDIIDLKVYNYTEDHRRLFLMIPFFYEQENKMQERKKGSDNNLKENSTKRLKDTKREFHPSKKEVQTTQTLVDAQTLQNYAYIQPETLQDSWVYTDPGEYSQYQEYPVYAEPYTDTYLAQSYEYSYPESPPMALAQSMSTDNLSTTAYESQLLQNQVKFHNTMPTTSINSFEQVG